MTDKVAIVGAGLVGRAWAISFARGGHRVMIFDADDKAVASALSTVDGMLRTLELRGMLKGQTAADVRSRMTGASSLEMALAGAAHVQENVPEDLGIKREMFAKLDAASEKNAVLASSSSGILPSRISAELAGKSRCLVAHPINPPYLIPAVELVPATWTDPQVVERTRQRLAGLGQVPIVMRRELDGFIMNRLQGAVLHEASVSSPKAMPRQRMWTPEFARASDCAGRLWGRSKQSISTRPAGFAITSTATKGCIGHWRNRRRCRCLGQASSWTGLRRSAAVACRGRILPSGRNGAIAD
jgi:hypothetical protein